MNEIEVKEYQLPDNIQDLSKFVLIGREKLSSVRAEIRAIQKVHLAQEVYEQKKGELNLLSAAMIDAEVKLGELMKDMPKAQGRRSDITCSQQCEEVKTKDQAIKDLGFDKDQASRFETLADNKKVVEIEKYRAKEEDRPVTREKALKAARFVKQLPEDQRRQIESLPVEQAAAKFTELYNSQLNEDIENSSDIDFGLSCLYEVKFTPESIKGYADGSVQDWEFELNRLDTLIKNLIRLRKALEERSRF